MKEIFQGIDASDDLTYRRNKNCRFFSFIFRKLSTIELLYKFA